MEWTQSLKRGGKWSLKSCLFSVQIVYFGVKVALSKPLREAQHRKHDTVQHRAAEGPHHLWWSSQRSVGKRTWGCRGRSGTSILFEAPGRSHGDTFDVTEPRHFRKWESWPSAWTRMEVEVQEESSHMDDVSLKWFCAWKERFLRRFKRRL